MTVLTTVDWGLVARSAPTIALGAVRGTIPLALLSFSGGMVIAVAVALMRLSRSRVVQGIGRAYVSVVRGTPLLVQLFVIFYGLPSIGLVIDPWPSAVLAFSLNVGGYAAEIVRAAILSVPQGQWEAAGALGLHRGFVLRHVVLPQALRVIVPPMTSQYLNLIKNSSLAIAIGYQDIVSITGTTLNQTGQSIECIALVMAVYLVFSLSISLFMNWYNAHIALVER